MNKLTPIIHELKHHAPFTLFGACTGIACMLIFKNMSNETSLKLFQVFHPAHVVLSAMVTSGLYMIYKKKTSIIMLLIIGYFGSIGIATLSDSILPFFGESLLGVAIPAHANLHELHETEEANEPENHETASIDEHEHEESEIHLHLGFIEEWYIVNPAAFLGILIAYFLPRTKFPHAGHVLLSTWASSFHVLMNTHRDLSVTILFGMIFVLFISVWLPCCISDIVFPMLFVKPGEYKPHHHH
ncbi:MAG: hypothetical protein JXA96_01740 [Sedimentisphaerales bacterium]|nr:hypothetical protein [Sedimentisphaerales bacterium]